MQINKTPQKPAYVRRGMGLLAVYLLCIFHHQMADVAHVLVHLTTHLLEPHDHELHVHHHRHYLDEVAENTHAELHHQTASHHHPLLALFDWKDDQDATDATAPQPAKSRKQIDQHLGVLVADLPISGDLPPSESFFLVKINRSLPHLFLFTPPPENPLYRIS